MNGAGIYREIPSSPESKTRPEIISDSGRIFRNRVVAWDNAQLIMRRWDFPLGTCVANYFCFACATISIRTLLASAASCTSRENAMRAPRGPAGVFSRT